MKQVSLHILENTALAQGIYRLRLGGDVSAVTDPGQFVNIKLNGFFLRRPISVCDWSKDSVTIVYKTVGDGTRALSQMKKGDCLGALCALGNGFDVSVSTRDPLLVGGGVGTPPLYGLAKALLAKGARPRVCVGFNTAKEAFLLTEFAAIGCPVLLSTADGSAGIKGFVTDAVAQSAVRYDYLFACGPEPMLKAVYDFCPADGQFSFEERMACGIGACMGCSCRTKYGYKRICRDGPVLRKEEIVW